MGRYSNYDDYKLDNPYHDDYEDDEPDYDLMRDMLIEEEFINLNNEEPCND
jgi:hypothetical protein